MRKADTSAVTAVPVSVSDCRATSMLLACDAASSSAARGWISFAPSVEQTPFRVWACRPASGQFPDSKAMSKSAEKRRHSRAQTAAAAADRGRHCRRHGAGRRQVESDDLRQVHRLDPIGDRRDRRARGDVVGPGAKATRTSRNPASVAYSRSGSIGLLIWPFMPSTWQRWRSSAMAWAVIAMMGRLTWFAIESELARRFVAVHDRHLQVHQHHAVVPWSPMRMDHVQAFLSVARHVDFDAARLCISSTASCWLIGLSSTSRTRSPARCRWLAVRVRHEALHARVVARPAT